MNENLSFSPLLTFTLQKGIAGVYFIKHLATDRVYVGKAKDIHRRIKSHVRLAKSGTTGQHTHRALSKYGFEDFAVAYLEVPVALSGEAEAKYVAFFRKEKGVFNMTDGNDGSFGRVMTEKTREKIRKANMGKAAHPNTREALKKAAKRKHSSERVAKRVKSRREKYEALTQDLKEVQNEKFRQHYSTVAQKMNIWSDARREARAKLSKGGNNPNARAIVFYPVNSYVCSIYHTIKDFYLSYGCSENSATKYVKQGKTPCGAVISRV